VHENMLREQSAGCGPPPRLARLHQERARRQGHYVLIYKLLLPRTGKASHVRQAELMKWTIVVVMVKPLCAAMRLLRLAAAQGCGGAVDDLSEIYMRGAYGVEKDFPVAIKYLRSAAVANSTAGGTISSVKKLHATLIHLSAIKACMCCGKAEAPRKCSGCGDARYCDGVCQARHWKHSSASHKAECRGAYVVHGGSSSSGLA
jgi:hypothetical protein